MSAGPKLLRKLRDGRVVVDEWCSCDHLRSQHGDSHPLAHGHGACSCPKFTWMAFVFQGDPRLKGDKP